MTPDFFSTLTVVLYVVYVCVNGLWTREFYRIQELGRRFKSHVVFCALLAAAGGAAWTSLGRGYQLGTAYLFMPAVYLLLLIAASQWTQRRHGRHLILATNNNMQSEATSGAGFSDYLLFLVVHVVPMVVPLMMFES